MVHDFEYAKFVTKHEIIKLSPIENIILDELLKNKHETTTYGQLFSRLKYISETYDCDDVISRGALRPHIQRLNKKMYRYMNIKVYTKVGYFLQVI